jgi:GH43 family beta-xylosidase
VRARHAPGGWFVAASAAALAAGCARPGRGAPPAGAGAPSAAAAAAGAGAGAGAGTFTNPIVAREAGDPWVVRHGGRYYFTATLDPQGGVWVWESPTLTGLGAAPRRVKVWTAPPSGPMSRQIWAPELHRLRGRWYLYFTASDGVDANHRHYVLAARTDDPLGAYGPPARVDPAYERYAIDGSVLEMPDGRLYWMYCADGPENGVYIAPMSAPDRVGGPRVRIVAGTEPWERGWRKAGGRWERGAGYWLEAPEALVRGGRVFVAYSAGHTATPHYYLGLLSLAPGGDPMDPRAWTKQRAPALGPYAGPDGGVYTPGHNSFTTSPDGREHWLVYHAKDDSGGADGGNERGVRTVRAQPITWSADGTPQFGRPVPTGVPLRKPSGE